MPPILGEFKRMMNHRLINAQEMEFRLFGNYKMPSRCVFGGTTL